MELVPSNAAGWLQAAALEELNARRNFSPISHGSSSPAQMPTPVCAITSLRAPCWVTAKIGLPVAQVFVKLKWNLRCGIPLGRLRRRSASQRNRLASSLSHVRMKFDHARIHQFASHLPAGRDMRFVRLTQEENFDCVRIQLSLLHQE
jgi:hypothetical protein